MSLQFLTSCMTWSRGAILTSSPLICRIWSPGINLFTLGPPLVTNLEKKNRTNIHNKYEFDGDFTSDQAYEEGEAEFEAEEDVLIFLGNILAFVFTPAMSIYRFVFAKFSEMFGVPRIGQNLSPARTTLVYSSASKFSPNWPLTQKSPHLFRGLFIHSTSNQLMRERKF